MDIEVCISSNTNVTTKEMRQLFQQVIDNNKDFLTKGLVTPESIPFPSFQYNAAIEHITIYGKNEPINIHCYHLNDENSFNIDVEGDDDEKISVFIKTILPNKRFLNLWDSIIENNDIKSNLINFMKTSIEFGEYNVCPDTVTSNRIILLYGPPGTGKTTICKGLSQKLAIILSDKYQRSVLYEVNTHSLFSKWFAESGKMVKKLFDKVKETAEDKSSLNIVLIDEVESIATTRNASINGSDPSDAIRVVNALLTQIDQLKSYPNVLILATSNLTECIDLAFLSRADIKQYIGNPGKETRYKILLNCIDELMKKSLISNDKIPMDFSSVTLLSKNSDTSHFRESLLLYEIAELSEGLSGRQLRKLPFLSFIYRQLQRPVTLEDFLIDLKKATVSEINETKLKVNK